MTAKSLFTHLALAAALSVGGYVGSEALAPLTGVSLVGQAQAQVKYTGRIKRVRIKKRRVGSGFKISVTTESGDSKSTKRVGTTLTDAAAAALEDHVVRKPVEGLVRASGPAMAMGGGGQYTVMFWVRPRGRIASAKGKPAPVSATFDALSSEAAVVEAGDGWLISAALSDGVLTTTLTNTNLAWGGDGVSQVAVAVGAEAPVELNDISIEQTWEADLETDLALLDAIGVETAVFGGNGNNPSDFQLQTVGLNPEVIVPGLSDAAFGTNEAGEETLSLVTRGEGQIEAVTVEVVDAVSDTSLVNARLAAPTQSERGFFVDGLTFRGDNEPALEGYVFDVALLDEAGESLAAHQVTVAAPAPVSGDVASNYQPFGDGNSTLGMLVDDDGYSLNVGTLVPGVRSVRVTFVESPDGPTPSVGEWLLPQVVQFDVWNAATPGAGGGANTITTVTALGPGDEVLDVTTFGGESVGKASGNGKGTKKASNQVQNQHLALL